MILLRHHTNPVGTEWRWKMDEADHIVNEAIKNHRSMIKQFRGLYSCAVELIAGTKIQQERIEGDV